MRLIGALLLVGSLTACAAKQPITETSETVVPYWIDGVCYVSSAMIDKNEYWLEKYRLGKATPDDLVRLVRSNNRFYAGLIGRMEAHKECAKIAKEQLLAEQEDK